MDMAKLIRRLTIIVLLMAIFAMSFASLVVNPNRSFQRVNAGAALACQQSPVPASSCPVVL
ncbi:hypothetical protein [Rhizobium sp. RM]|uniref:hypothetical protein n=1 Tax=Rhizobium/Agrobacterium group TaxID=227290 RepID=UPI00110D474B|nr:hypothetical protein [Agrobacterium tumefaciens]NWJ22673.1 hypothetical protein [Rhizobium sp. RM]TMV12414.1 hypothetical protein BJG94_25960 [Rhizobium sp. Td3]UXS00619.1 hypothetical protein FY156_03515 [Agrobacterium tumefaciens]